MSLIWSNIHRRGFPGGASAEESACQSRRLQFLHRLNADEFEQAMEIGDGQGGLVCCDSWGHKELDTTE